MNIWINNKANCFSISLCCLLFVFSAGAEVLTPDELASFERFVPCANACRAGRRAQLETCLSGCGDRSENWEKNQQEPIDQSDLVLAWLEYWDEGAGTHICYENGAVVPKSLCGYENCVEKRGETECQDEDGDGLRKWQEEIINRSDLPADNQIERVCTTDADCGGFDEICSDDTLETISTSLCTPRECQGTCTAFHLEKISADNTELIVHVHYDYSPVPARILDLLIEYDSTVLTLVDSRPLKPLKDAAKTLYTKHPSSNKLRLIIMGTESSILIPNGPIVELVFFRKSKSQSDHAVAFSKSDYAQEWSMAPDPEKHRESLRDDKLWGSDIAMDYANPNGDRLLLYYSFDNGNAPLDYSDVKNAEELCALFSDCNNLSNGIDSEKTKKAKLKGQLAVLQRGTAYLGGSIDGVSGRAVYFNGVDNHLELPVTLNDPGQNLPYDPKSQSFSLSTWFYVEDKVESEDFEAGQVLFSHSNNQETSRFSLLVRPLNAEWAELSWVENSLTDPLVDKKTTIITREIKVRTWTHLGLRIDAHDGKADFIVNGQLQPVVVALETPPDVIGCPKFDNYSNGLSLHQEGEDGTRIQDALFFASSLNNLFGISRMDLAGLSQQEIVREPGVSSGEPDYLPALDKIVYSTNQSGAFEIWIADGNGENAKQITKGFGDTTRGIFARRPKWAPDGSAIVFESNVFDKDTTDNFWSRGYHLYYIGYNPEKNEVSVPLASGSVANELNYNEILGTQAIQYYRLTETFRDTMSFTNAIWLRGRFQKGEGDTKTDYWGEIVVSSKDMIDKSKMSVHRILIPYVSDYTNSGFNPEFAKVVSNEGRSNSELKALTAYYSKKVSQAASSHLLFKNSYSSFEEADQFQIQISENEQEAVVTVFHTPHGYEAHCWDTNLNEEKDDSENINNDNKVDTLDCYPSEVRDLYLKFNIDTLYFNKSKSSAGAALSSEAPGVNKSLVLESKDTDNGSYVKIEVISEVNNLPLPDRAEVAKIVFTKKNTNTGGTLGISLTKRNVREEFYTKDLLSDSASVPFVINSGGLEQILDAAFSPDGNQLVLSGIENARPVLVTTKEIVYGADKTVTAGVDKISNKPLKTKGMAWKNFERLYPCNWVGAFRNKQNHRIFGAFRGGLDEFRMYSYLRTEAAFLSDAERGIEQLEAEERFKPVDSLLPTCTNSDLECPANHLCQKGKCEIVGCKPEDAYPCKRGTCTLAPVSLGDLGEEMAWVCIAECNDDKHCFEQECLNGPCRFCEDFSSSCLECKPVTEKVGGIDLSYIAGCPDRNSFRCDQGSCLTDCYSFENGQSKYLCEPGFEYCHQGRCVAFSWSWKDFGPMTMSGLGEVRVEHPNLPFTTVAISQLYPIEITAYGVADYMNAPQVLVEGRHSALYGGEWFEIGTVSVHNKSKKEASQNKYIVTTQYPVQKVRLRLVTPPYMDMNRTAHGLLKGNKFCEDLGLNQTECVRKAAGSRATLGYTLGFTEYEKRRQCYGRKKVDPDYRGECSEQDDPNMKYLRVGQPAVIINNVEVNGQGILTEVTGNANTICSYEGDIEPLKMVDGLLLIKKLYYGDVSKEISNQKDVFYKGANGSGLIHFMAETHGEWALLNCNYAVNDAELARLELAVSEASYPKLGKGKLTKGKISETSNECSFEIDENRRKPCYEWVGSGPSLDVMREASADQLFGELEFGEYRSFGYDNYMYLLEEN